MLDDKFPQLIRSTFPFKIAVASTYQAKQTLYSKGISPSIFLNEFYKKKEQGQQIFYYVKQKGCRPIGEVVAIDLDEYSCYNEQTISKGMKDIVANCQFKAPRSTSRQDLKSRVKVESHINNINFHWFQSTVKFFMHSMTLGQQTFKFSTFEQPVSLIYMIEVDNKPCKEHFQKLRKETEQKFKKIFHINPKKITCLPVAVYLLFDMSKGKNYDDAKTYSTYLRQTFKIEFNMICMIGINGTKCTEYFCWSSYERPILNIKYALKSTDPVRIIGQEEYGVIKEVVYTHKVKIKKFLEERLETLGKRYQESNKVGNRFFNFFKSTPTTERSYSEEECESRQIADILFLLQDYKKAYELYKDLAKKFDVTQRDQSIYFNLCQMIEWCLTLCKSQGIKLRSNPCENILKHAQRKMIRKVAGLSRYRLHRYLMFLIYAFYSFRVFDKEFIKNHLYYYIKKTVNEQTKQNSSIMPVLLYEQYSNLDLLYPVSQPRRYCYDLIRVGTKFNEFKLTVHYLRCLSIVNSIYADTFPMIERFINISLSKAYLQLGDYEFCLQKLRSTWQVLLQANDYNQNIGEDVGDSQFVKLTTTHHKIINEIVKQDSKSLEQERAFTIKVPTISNISIQLMDEKLESEIQNIEKTSWQQVGDIFLEQPQLTSKGMNKQYMIRMLKMFDAKTAEQKQLAFRVKINGNISEAIIKRNCRTCYLGEPIKVNFMMNNPLPNAIEIMNVSLQTNPQNSTQVKIISEQILSIRPFQSSQLEFTIIPKSLGLISLKSIEWIFSKLKSEYKLKEADDMATNLKSFYNKVNVLQASGKLAVSIKDKGEFYEGQLAEIQILLENQGTSDIDEIYFATDGEQIFGFKLQKIHKKICPGQTIKETFKIKIPLVGDKTQSGLLKHTLKSIFLYKTGSGFRTYRHFTILKITKIAEFSLFKCERLSKTLHLLSFNINYGSRQEESKKLLKSLVIGSGFEIKKVEKNHYGKATVQFYLFMRKNNEEAKNLAEYKFDPLAQNFQELAEKNLSEVQGSSMKVLFFWQNQKSLGIIEPSLIPIKPVQTTQSLSLPFHFRVNVESEISHNFSEYPFLEIDVQIQIKNIFQQKLLNLIVEFSDANHNGFYWQGINKQEISLSHNQEERIKIKMVIVRAGIFDIARGIKYHVAINRGNNYQLRHSQYESIYVIIDDTHCRKSSDNNFDFFDQIKPPMGKKEETQNYDLI